MVIFDGVVVVWDVVLRVVVVVAVDVVVVLVVVEVVVVVAVVVVFCRCLRRCSRGSSLCLWLLWPVTVVQLLWC